MPFFFYSYGHHRDLHSFPTRRSSDLDQGERRGQVGERQYGMVDKDQEFAADCRADKRGCYNPPPGGLSQRVRSEEHTSELQSHVNLVCRLLLEKKKKNNRITFT